MAEEPVVDIDTEIQDLKNIEAEWGAAIAAGDIEKALSFFADNALVIPANESPLIGKETYREFMQKQLDQYTMVYGGTLEDVQVSCDLAFTRGTSKLIITPKAGGNTRTSNGNWVCIYRKQPDGTWKCILNNWSDESLVSPLLETE